MSAIDFSVEQRGLCRQRWQHESLGRHGALGPTIRVFIVSPPCSP